MHSLKVGRERSGVHIQGCLPTCVRVRTSPPSDLQMEAFTFYHLLTLTTWQFQWSKKTTDQLLIIGDGSSVGWGVKGHLWQPACQLWMGRKGLCCRNDQQQSRVFWKRNDKVNIIPCWYLIMGWLSFRKEMPCYIETHFLFINSIFASLGAPLDMGVCWWLCMFMGFLYVFLDLGTCLVDLLDRSSGLTANVLVKAHLNATQKMDRAFRLYFAFISSFILHVTLTAQTEQDHWNPCRQ